MDAPSSHSGAFLFYCLQGPCKRGRPIANLTVLIAARKARDESWRHRHMKKDQKPWCLGWQLLLTGSLGALTRREKALPAVTRVHNLEKRQESHFRVVIRSAERRGVPHISHIELGGGSNQPLFLCRRRPGRHCAGLLCFPYNHFYSPFQLKHGHFGISLGGLLCHVGKGPQAQGICPPHSRYAAGL